MRGFMLKQTRQADVALFSRLAKLDSGIKPEDVPFKVLVPAFVTSELKSAFQIAFLIFIPFLVIDMIVVAGAGLPALQADAVRAGGWVEPAAWLFGRFVCDLIWTHNRFSPSASRAST